MKSLDHHDRPLTVNLSPVAGYVDAVECLITGGFSVSSMSGNSTRRRVDIADMSANAGVAVIARQPVPVAPTPA